MKKNALFILLLLLLLNSFVFSQIKIGHTTDENILEIKKISNDIVYTCVEEKNGLISIIQNFFCVINEQKYGPFSKQPEIKMLDYRFYVIFELNDKKGIIYNNKIYGPYEKFDDLYFSNDFSKFLISYFNTDDFNILLENGVEVRSSYYPLYDIAYNSKNELCYTFEQGDGYYVRVGEDLYGPFSYIDSFYFDSNGDWYIQIDLDDEEFFLCNGKLYEKNEFETKFHVGGYPNVKKNSSGYYYTNENIRSESFDEIDLESVEFFEERKIPVFIAKKSNDIYIVKNCTKKYGPYKKMSNYDVYYDKMTGKLLYIDNDRSLYQDGNLLSNALSYPAVWISDNWATYCYKEQRSDGQYLVANEEKIGPYDKIIDIKLSKDGKKVVYGAKKDSKYYVFDGIKKYGPYNDIFNLTLSSQNDLAFSYTNEEDNEFITYKGNTYGPYKSVYSDSLDYSFLFSQNGEHFAAYVTNETFAKEKFLFVDGVLSCSLPCNASFSIIFSKKTNEILCSNHMLDYFYLNSKKINGKLGYDFSFEQYGIVSYREETNNKVINHLLIGGNNYIGSFLWNDFIYLDNGNIMYIKN